MILERRYSNLTFNQSIREPTKSFNEKHCALNVSVIQLCILAMCRRVNVLFSILAQFLLHVLLQKITKLEGTCEMPRTKCRGLVRLARRLRPTRIALFLMRSTVRVSNMSCQGYRDSEGLQKIECLPKCQVAGQVLQISEPFTCRSERSSFHQNRLALNRTWFLPAKLPLL
jgi:hypothetical protein